jgi:hypothetical protein
VSIVKWPAQFVGSVLVVAWIAACDSSGVNTSSAGPGARGRPILTPPTGDFVVRGQVFDSYNGLIGGAHLNIWLHTDNGGYSYGSAYGELLSSEAGRYETVRLPESTVWIPAYKDSYVQPCVVSVELREPAHDVEVDVELVSPATLDSFAPPRPTYLPGPAFTGSVFETTPTGKQPIGGAYISVDGLGGLDLVIATTYSDLAGKFFLCNLPADAWLVVDKPDFAPAELWLTDTSQPMDIELKRR